MGHALIPGCCVQVLMMRLSSIYHKYWLAQNTVLMLLVGFVGHIFTVKTNIHLVRLFATSHFNPVEYFYWWRPLLHSLLIFVVNAKWVYCPWNDQKAINTENEKNARCILLRLIFTGFRGCCRFYISPKTEKLKNTERMRGLFSWQVATAQPPLCRRLKIMPICLLLFC